MWKRNGEGDERKVRENEMKREKDMCQMRGSQVKWKWVWVNESDQELMSCQMV